MIRILSRFLAWLKVGVLPPLCPDTKPDWTKSEASALAAFLHSRTGRKLKLVIRYQEQAINASAVGRAQGCEFNCGYASGFRTACLLLQNLSANVPPHPDDDSQNPEGAEDLAERHAP